ncbi:MAG: transcriptional regulator, partial [Angelakisella sp.]
ILEDAGLLITCIQPAVRGTQRICTKSYADIFINLDPRYTPDISEGKEYVVDMPVGGYCNCKVNPTCGLIGSNGIIASEDHPSSFFSPNHFDAGMLWFRTGYIMYNFPNDIADFPGLAVDEISFTLELCSEAPNYDMDWPSDITFWVGGVEVATWTCPGDFGDRPGKITSFIALRKYFTQYGLLKKLIINREGTFIDDERVSNVTIDEVYSNAPAVEFMIGVKDDAANKGGVNIFGSTFGDYPQNIIMKIRYFLK